MTDEETKSAEEAIKENKANADKVLAELDTISHEDIMNDDSILVEDMFKGCGI